MHLSSTSMCVTSTGRALGAGVAVAESSPESKPGTMAACPGD